MITDIVSCTRQELLAHLCYKPNLFLNNNSITKVFHEYDSTKTISQCIINSSDYEFTLIKVLLANSHKINIRTFVCFCRYKPNNMDDYMNSTWIDTIAYLGYHDDEIRQIIEIVGNIMPSDEPIKTIYDKLTDFQKQLVNMIYLNRRSFQDDSAFLVFRIEYVRQFVANLKQNWIGNKTHILLDSFENKTISDQQLLVIIKNIDELVVNMKDNNMKTGESMKIQIIDQQKGTEFINRVIDIMIRKLYPTFMINGLLINNEVYFQIRVV